MLKITRDKAWVKYIEWNGMELYCSAADDYSGWKIELCISPEQYAFGRFTINSDFSLDAIQKGLDIYYSVKTKCRKLLFGIFNGFYKNGLLYPEYIK